MLRLRELTIEFTHFRRPSDWAKPSFHHIPLVFSQEITKYTTITQLKSNFSPH